MAAGNSACVGSETLAPAEKLIEGFLFGLRMNRGVDLGRLEQKFGLELPFDRKEAIGSFMEMGLLEESGEHIRATPRGRLLLDEISRGSFSVVGPGISGRPSPTGRRT